ncbi:MAG: 3'-5' exonuclease [Clostridium sp.]|nr:3'-5' exonuclease [Clostridium sp.]
MLNRDKSLKIFPLDYIVLDIETTGLSPAENEIIELSALKVKNGNIVEQFSKLVKPKGYLNSFITDLTGINKEMLEQAPSIDKAIWEFNQFCTNSIIIGHNVTFDISFINRKLLECHNIPFNNEYVDTLTIARKFLPDLKSKKLGNIAQHFKFNTDGMHRGLKDCIVTNLCYQKFLQMHKEQQLKQVNALGLQF